MGTKSHGSYTSNNQKSWKIYRYMKNKQETPEQPMGERRNQIGTKDYLKINENKITFY